MNEKDEIVAETMYFLQDYFLDTFAATGAKLHFLSVQSPIVPQVKNNMLTVTFTQADDPKENNIVPQEDNITNETPPPSAASLNDPKETIKGSSSSAFSPPLKVFTTVSGTIVTMGSSLSPLSKSEEKRQQEQLFHPPKDDAKSVAEATMIEDEDSLVECVIGDDDFSTGSRSTRRSRADFFLRLIEDEGRPTRFLVANASRGRGLSRLQTCVRLA